MREDISFQTADNVTLRGWFYKPEARSRPLPCLVLAHGFTALKEMDLDVFAEYFTSNLPITCLVYDHRGFGDSDTKEGEPRHEIIPAKQISDYSDAITYAQSRADVNPEKIGVWGSSYSGGHVLWLGAVDRRVKAVISQNPCTNGWENFHRLVRPDFLPSTNAIFQQDRLDRAAGKPAGVLPVVSPDVHGTTALPTLESYEFFSAWEKKSGWKNEVTIKTLEAFREYLPDAHIEHIAPTPLLMVIAAGDILAPAEIALGSYARAREPKELCLLPGGHFDTYSGPNFAQNSGRQAEFLKKYLCD